MKVNYSEQREQRSPNLADGMTGYTYDLFQGNILTCHSGKSPGVINNTKVGEFH